MHALCACVWVCVYLYVYLCVYLCVYLYVYLYMYHTHVYLYMCHMHARAAGRTDWNGQVLSHQYKIASKLELFVGTCPDADKLSYQKCKWKRLGYLSLGMCHVT